MVGEIPAPLPAAPSSLAVSAIGGSAHLTWKDPTADAMHFMVMRMMHDGPTAGQMTELASVAAGRAEYHDATIEAGMTYMYLVAAMNDGGERDSGEVSFAAP